MYSKQQTGSITKWIFSFLLIICLFPVTGLSQAEADLTILQPLNDVRPLDKVTVKCVGSGILSVKDASGREYVNMPATNLTAFYAGGTAGEHNIALMDKKGKTLASATFNMVPETNIDDDGRWKELFEILKKGMYDLKGEVN